MISNASSVSDKAWRTASTVSGRFSASFSAGIRTQMERALEAALEDLMSFPESA
jgi:hypothetical protein